MIYDTLGTYYDALVKDEQATQAWVGWIQRFCAPCDVLELACGSGEITAALHQLGYRMSALDLSRTMIEQAQKKSKGIDFYCQDMKDLSRFRQFDAVACLCDSFNYILSKEEVVAFFDEVYAHIKDDGLFFFDTHALDRLQEFKKEWNETGMFENGVHYQWSITSEDDWIYQDFAFYRPDGSVVQEHHLQRVYDPQWLAAVIRDRFEIVDLCTDFDRPGIGPGEKYFYVLRKKEWK